MIAFRKLPNAIIDIGHVRYKRQVGQSQDDILCHRHGVHQHKILVNHPDAEQHGIPRRIDIDAFAFDKDLARIGPVHAGQDIHEGTFARPVFTQQGQYFAGIKLHIHVFVGHHIGEALGDPLHFQNRRLGFV